MKISIKLLMCIFCVSNILNLGCNDSQKQIKSINVSRTYELDTLESSAKWNRFLEQGETKTKVKLFGQLADVTIDGLKLNTDGKVVLNSGQMVNYNDTLTKGEVNFDLNLVGVNKQNTKNDKFLKTKQLEGSKFDISVTEEEPKVFYIVNKMTIGDSIKEPFTTASFDLKNDSTITFTGEVKFNTLDWPIRDDENVKSVIKDEITMKMELIFNLTSINRDTIYMTN